jgi:hypothetical protein
VGIQMPNWTADACYSGLHRLFKNWIHCHLKICCHYSSGWHGSPQILWTYLYLEKGLCRR